MKIETIELLKALSSVRPGLAQKEIVEEMVHFIFTGEEVATYNDEICVIVPFKTDFSCSVKADTLFKYLLKLPQPEIDMDLKEGQLLIRAGKSKAEFPISANEGIFSYLEKVADSLEEGEWKKTPENFFNGIKLCSFSAAKDRTMGTLTCVHVVRDSIYSSDQTRMSRFRMKGEMEGFLIEAATLQKLYGIHLNFDEYMVTKSWINFRTRDDVLFSARRVLSQEDLKWDEKEKQFILKGTQVEIPPKLKDALDKISIVLSNLQMIDKSVNISLRKGKMLCSGGSAASGFIEEEVELDYSLDNKDFSINVVYLQEALDKSQKFAVSDRHAQFESENFLHFSALMIER